jgi:RHH-type transcriptional regulator, proline utilization regulon repressor / proline dehydrogenase / delta 1-pyrroline-5-carboxylate dehydrogenase
MRVGWPQHPLSQVGPIIEPAAGKLLRALTTLGEGEQWLVEPNQLDDTGRLWSPGVRTGVLPGSEFHLTEYFGPVLGIMTAESLDEAIDLQNASDYGLTAGIHSLDVDEVSRWAARVEAGNLYINRGITGAIVERQPFGGWKRSTVGTSAKAGGPNYLLTLGSWKAVESAPRSTVVLDGVGRTVAAVVAAAQPALDFADFDRIRVAAQSDERAWVAEYGISRDVAGLGVERNVFRYRPVPVDVRLAEGSPVSSLVRVIAAAARAGAPISVSSALPLPAQLVGLLGKGVAGGGALVNGALVNGALANGALVDGALVNVSEIVVETDAAWLARVESGALTAARIRLIGGGARGAGGAGGAGGGAGRDAGGGAGGVAGGVAGRDAGGVALAVAIALEGSPDVAVYAGDVTTSGRIELLPFLREQAVALTAHRFGNPDAAFLALPL